MKKSERTLEREAALARRRPPGTDATLYDRVLRFLTPKGRFWRRVNVRKEQVNLWRKVTEGSVYVRADAEEEVVLRMRADGLIVHSDRYPTSDEQDRIMTEVAANMDANERRYRENRLRRRSLRPGEDDQAAHRRVESEKADLRGATRNCDAGLPGFPRRPKRQFGFGPTA
jgi:hypothetical protein